MLRATFTNRPRSRPRDGRAWARGADSRAVRRMTGLPNEAGAELGAAASWVTTEGRMETARRPISASIRPLVLPR